MWQTMAATKQIRFETAGGLWMRKQLLMLIVALFGLHAVAILLLPHAVALSRVETALMPACAALCAIWRSTQLSARERTSWWWVAASMLLWSSGQLVEVWIGASPAASSLVIDKSDLLYLTSAFPLLLAISNTSETEPIRGIFFLNLFQAGLAAALTWVRVFRTPMASDLAQTVLMRIYAAECILLVIAATVRLVSWATLEERRRMRLICAVLWLYLPVELGMDYATRHWHLQQGTLLDLLWSVPFAFAGWRSLKMPMDERQTVARRRARRTATHARLLLLQSLCPMLITIGVFALASSIVQQHVVLAMLSILALLVVQGLLSGVIQVSYLQSQAQLLRKESELKAANAGLERLSLIDPLTGIANRRQFNEVFESEWKRASRKQNPVAVLMIDVDFFKSVNDLHGHTYGDECLVQVAQALRSGLNRATDMVARYGGEEFVVLLPDTDPAGAMTVAERLHAIVTDLRLPNRASPFDECITVSIGVAAMQSAPLTRGGALIDQADRALYAAKHGGRNCIREFEYSHA